MEGPDANAIGRVFFVTKGAKNGNNKIFHIYGESFVPANEISTDCQKITGLNDDLNPPKKYEDWVKINQVLDELGCPTQQPVITFNCGEGRVRSATMAGLYMIRCLGMTATEAWRTLDKAYPSNWSSDNRQRVETYIMAYWNQGAYLRTVEEAHEIEKQRRAEPSKRPRRGSVSGGKGNQ